MNHDIVIYNFRLELVEQLINAGYEVIISSPNGKRIEYLTEMGCKHIESKISRRSINFIKDIKLFTHYRKIIKNIKPNLILTYTIKPNIYGGFAARLLNVQYISNITGLGTATENSGFLQKIIILLYKIAFKKVNTVFLQNVENKMFFEKNRIALGKHELIPGSGVNLNRYIYLPYPEDKTIEFVFIARIMKEKGIEHYLEAAKFIKEKYPFTVFHICGLYEQDYSNIIEQYANNKIVEYHGMVNDIKTILKRIHCTVHPSYYPEGISNALLESCACGRPIITTDRSGCREVVDDGINGFLVQPKSSSDLISKIEKFINLPYEEKIQMGIAGRKKMELEFSREIVVNAYMNKIMKIPN